jgi:hypothetical protein
MKRSAMITSSYCVASSYAAAIFSIEAAFRDARCLPHELGPPLVHRQRARHHSAAGVRQAQVLERALHRPVLAEAPVQCDEHAVEVLRDELFEPLVSRVEAVRVDAALPERREHHVAAPQRDLALGAAAAQQHGHFAKSVARGT